MPDVNHIFFEQVITRREVSAKLSGYTHGYVFDTNKSLDLHRYNVVTCNEVAVVYVGEDKDVPATRNFAVNSYSGGLLKMFPQVFNLLRLSRPLFQLCVADAWVKTEQSRLNYVCTNQTSPCCDSYRALQDFVPDNHNGSPGKRVILLSLVGGGPQAMIGEYQDTINLEIPIPKIDELQKKPLQRSLYQQMYRL